MTSSEWIVIPRPNPTARVQLLCLPNAGGGVATFAPWAQLVPGWIELALVQLPGRDARRREPFFQSMSEAAEGLASAVRGAPGRPRVLFGHSMGAVIAFEACRLLVGTPCAPAGLVVSGRKAPSLPELRTAISHLPMQAFVAEAQRRYGGIPAVVLEDADLRDFLLPILRADLASIENYRFERGALLDCPIVAYVGTDDPHATIEEMDPWRRETTAAFTLRQFVGGHFFVHTARTQVLAALVADIAESHLNGLG